MNQSIHPQEIKLGIYKHYKGGIYKLHFIATHSETLEKLVIYEQIKGDHVGSIWARPLSMFKEDVEWEGKTVKRFTYIKE